MKILATIKKGYDRQTMLFPTVSAAQHWIDEHNPNMEFLSYIEEFDDNWYKTGGFIYTEGRNNES